MTQEDAKRPLAGMRCGVEALEAIGQPLGMQEMVSDREIDGAGSGAQDVVRGDVAPLPAHVPNVLQELVAVLGRRDHDVPLVLELTGIRHPGLI